MIGPGSDKNSKCPFFLPYFVFLFLPHPPNSKFVFTYFLSLRKCAESVILLKSPIFALIRCLVYLQRCRSVYLQKGSSLEATVVGWAQKVCNISKWIGRGRIAKVKKEKWIGTARLAQAKLRRKEKMLLLLFLCSQKPDPMEGWYGWNFEAQIVSTGFWMFYTLCTKDGPCHYPPHKIPSHRQVGW